MLLSLTGLLLASSLSVSAAPLRLGLAGTAVAEVAANQACAALRASPVFWVTLDNQGQIDQHVSDYPSSTTEIVPSFEYACVPKNTTIVTVFTYEDNAVLSDKEALRSSAQAGVYAYPLSTDDGGPLDQGELDGCDLVSSLAPPQKHADLLSRTVHRGTLWGDRREFSARRLRR